MTAISTMKKRASQKYETLEEEEQFEPVMQIFSSDREKPKTYRPKTNQNGNFRQ